MAKGRRNRARNFGSGGGGGGGLRGLTDSFGGTPELGEAAKKFVANPKEAEVPETIYDSPGFFSRVFFPTAAEAADEGNAAWNLSRIEDAQGQAAGGRTEKQELADRVELSFLDALSGDSISETNKARRQQLRDALAGKATTRLSNEGLENSNAAGRLANEENQQTSAGRVAAANALTALNAALSASRGREIPSAERANVMQNNRRRIDLSRVPDPDSAVVRDIDEASGNLGATPYEGGNYTVARDLEDFRYDRGVTQRDKEQQAAREFEASQAELNRNARATEGALDREARATGKADPLAALLGGANPEGPRQLGDGFVAVPRPAGTTAPSAPVTSSARPSEVAPRAAYRQSAAQPLTSSNLDQIRSETLPFSQLGRGFSGMANLLQPTGQSAPAEESFGNLVSATPQRNTALSESSAARAILGSALRPASDEAAIAASPWFKELSPQDQSAVIEQIRAKATKQ